MSSPRIRSVVSLLSIVMLALSTGRAQQAPLLSFEQVTYDSTAKRLYYEQRLYRNPMRGLQELYGNIPAQNRGTFVPIFQGIPIAEYALTPTFKTTLLTRADRFAYRFRPFNARQYKFDVRLLPDFTAIFGYRENPVESKTNLLLQSQLYLNRGLVLNWGVLLPLQNNLDNQPRNIRPAPLFLNQFLAFGQHSFVSASAGLFYNDRYGLNVQYRHASLTKPWSFGLETGLTGFYYFPLNGFYYESLQEVLFLADVAYRFGNRNVTLKLSGGQYLYQDRGVRFDFIRQFSNVDVGLYATKTVNGSTAGFNFAIPIPPGRLVQTNRFRVRTAEEFRWEYNYSRGYNVGIRYKVGYQLDALLRQYHHQYLRSQLAE